MALALFGAISHFGAVSHAADLTAMTFNVRYAVDRGDLAWEQRLPRIVEVIRSQAPDVVGVQEAQHRTLLQLLAALPEYAATGVPRAEASIHTEIVAILYRRDRFLVAEAGAFWISATPDRPGPLKAGPDAPRLTTFARLIDDDGSTFWVYNTHWNVNSLAARELGAKLLGDHIDAQAEPVLVMGDFNATVDAPEMAALIGSRLVDAGGTNGTYNGFQRPDGSIKIDHVLVRPGTLVARAVVVQDRPGGRYASDHYPVVVGLTIPTSLPAWYAKLIRPD